MGAFFTAGGMGMYPTLAFGLLQLAAGVMYALQPERRAGWTFVGLGAATLFSGLLGLTLSAFTTTVYVSGLPEAEQYVTRLFGFAEALHNLALALIGVVLSTLVVAAGSLRAALRAGPEGRGR